MVAGREASEAVLASPELWRCITDLIDWHSDFDRRRGLARICLVSKATNAACTPILYRKVTVGKIWNTDGFPQVKGLLVALGRKRGYGQYVRQMCLSDMETGMASRILARCPYLESLSWSPAFHPPLSYPLQLPVLKSPSHLRELGFFNDQDYLFPVHAIEDWFSLLSGLTVLRTTCSGTQLQAALACIGHQLSKLALDTHKGLVTAFYDEKEWQEIFNRIPDLKHVEIIGWCHEPIFGALPDSVCTLNLHSADLWAIVLLLNRLADPTWLPNLTETPSVEKAYSDDNIARPGLLTDRQMMVRVNQARRGLAARASWVDDEQRWEDLLSQTSLCTMEAHRDFLADYYPQLYEQYYGNEADAGENEDSEIDETGSSDDPDILDSQEGQEAEDLSQGEH